MLGVLGHRVGDELERGVGRAVMLRPTSVRSIPVADFRASAESRSSSSSAVDGVEDAHVLQVVGHADVSDRHEPEPRVAQALVESSRATISR